MRRIGFAVIAGLLAMVLSSTPVFAREKSLSEYSGLITAAIDSGRLVQAAEMIAKVSPEAEGSPELMILQAELALAQKKNSEALKLFEVHVDHPTLSCRFREGAGIALVRQGKMQDSVEYFADVTLRCPDRWKSWNMMAMVLSQFEKLEASKHAFSRAIALSNRNPVVLNNFGYSLMSQKKFVEAKACFAEALKKQPDNIKYQNNLDIVQAVMGQRPVKLKSQSEQRWIERLNNSGYAARLAGRERMGVALLTEAVLNSRTMASAAAKNLNFGRTGETDK